jgi:hypothetical protein
MLGLQLAAAAKGIAKIFSARFPPCNAYFFIATMPLETSLLVFANPASAPIWVRITANARE